MDMQKNIRVNREHKDSLFRFIFRDKIQRWMNA